jgi:hypothetical protein
MFDSKWWVEVSGLLMYYVKNEKKREVSVEVYSTILFLAWELWSALFESVRYLTWKSEGGDFKFL